MPDDDDAQGLVANPSVGVGLNGLEDWSTAQPFLDHFKMARPWSGMIGQRFGAVGFDDLRAAGAVDAQGWLNSVPGGVTAVATVLLTELPEEARDLAGRYVLTWRGEADLQLLGTDDQARNGNRIEFGYAPRRDGHLELRVHRVMTPLRDIRVIRDDNLRRYRAGNLFRVEWLDRIRNYRLLRFMDWMGTNNSPLRRWQDRPRPSDAFHTWRGAPIEVMLRLANAVGADPWFTIPHLADDDFIRRFAGYVARHLRPGLRAHYEYSNEVWNSRFGQGQWAIERAARAWPGQGDGFMQYYAGSAVGMARILAEVYRDDPQACVKVISTHTHWPGLEGAVLDAPDWRRDNPTLAAPWRHFDAYAVSGYFDGGLDRPDNVARVARLAALSPARQRVALRDQLLAGGWPESGRTIANLREIWDHHARICRRRGLQMLMYEGGTHILPPPAVQADPALSQLYESFNYSVEMGQVYQAAMQEWRAAGGQVFNAFVECARPANYGYWGLQRHLEDENPRWAAVERWNATQPGRDDRPAGTFIGSYEGG